MRRTRAFATSSFRLAGLYTLLFAGSVAVLGAVVFFSAHAAMQDQLRDRVTTETASLLSSYESEGLGAVADLVRERSRSPAALDYRIEDRSGRMLAGDLPRPQVRSGWSVLTEPEDEEEEHGEESVLAWTATLDGEGLLVVGDDLARVEEADEAILRAFGSAFALVLVLGVVGGWILSRGFLNRVDAITLTAEAIIDGDLSRRIPLKAQSNDELEQLGAALNRMLDRIEALMDSLRQVSNDIAHDLRTPLTRLRQRLESSLIEGGDLETHQAAVMAAVGETDAILETFSAMLRIAQIEAGGRRAGFREVDLAALADTVVEAFSPSAEEDGRQLVRRGDAAVRLAGDAELLTQLLVNLVENALRHTPPGTLVEVVTSSSPSEPALLVKDNGPGIPPEARDKVTQRFVRLEASRTTPGSGLGLSLALAVSRLHDGELEIGDANPGLAVRVHLPRLAPATEIDHAVTLVRA